MFITCSGAGTFTVGGTAATGISGLEKNATIGLNLTASTGVNENLSVTNGTGAVSLNLAYTFANTFATGASVTVTIAQQPLSPHQTCTFPAAALTTGALAVGAINVVLPLITCTTNTYAVAGTVSGLTIGDIVGLQLNSATNGVANAVQTFTTAAATAASMPFTFATPITDGSSYTVTVTSFSPVGKTCGAPVTGVLSAAANVAITCAAGPTVSVTVSGFTGIGGNLGLRLNGNTASNLLASANGVFTFTTPVLNTGDNYSVTIYQQPNRLSLNSMDQLCYLSANASGVMPVVGIITATCSPVMYSLSGSISGLALGEQAVAYNNTTNVGQILTGAGTGVDLYSLPSMNDGSAYTLQTMQSPANKTCTFSSGGLPTVGGAIAGVSAIQNVICAPNPPKGISIVSGNASTTLSWQPYTFAGATSYNIYWSTVSPVTTLSTKIVGAVSPYTHTLLTNGTTYYYRVTGVNMAVESPLSVEFSALPLAPLGASEGTAGVPMGLTLATVPHNGGITGGVSSYYQVTGLAANANYVVTLSNMSGDVNLDVYNTAFVTALCRNYNGLVVGSIPTLVDNCVIKSNALGQLWIMISDPSGFGTLTYTVKVAAWPQVALPIAVLATYSTTSFTTFDVSAGPVWISFPVALGTQYTVHWNDSWDGNGSYAADVLVNGYDSLGNVLAVTSNSAGTFSFGNNMAVTGVKQVDSGYTIPTVFTSAAAGTVYLRVDPYFASGTVGVEVSSP